MSKKDYQAIARAIHDANMADAHTTVPLHPYREVAARIADVLAADNPRFDRARFIEACETGRCKGMPR